MGMQSLRTKLRKRKYKLGLGREHESSPGTNAGSEWQFETFSPHIFSSSASTSSSAASPAILSATSDKKRREKGADRESPPPVPPPRLGCALAVEPKRPSSWSPTSAPPVPPHAWQLVSGDSSADASALAFSASSKKYHVGGSNPNLAKQTRHKNTEAGDDSACGASGLYESNPDLKRSASCYQDPKDARLDPHQSSLVRSNRNLYGFLDFNWNRGNLHSNPRSSTRTYSCSNPRSIPRSNPRIIPAESIQQVPKVEPVYANPYRKKKAAAAAAAKQLLLNSQTASNQDLDGASNHIPELTVPANDIGSSQRATDVAEVVKKSLNDFDFSLPPDRDLVKEEEDIDREDIPPPIPPHGPGVTCTRIDLPLSQPSPPPSQLPSSPPALLASIINQSID